MKNSQRGNIGAGVIFIILFISTIVFAAFIGITSYISAANFGNEQEVAIKKIWENNQNILGQYTLKVQEIAQVPGIYKDDLKDIIAAEMSGRYGANGSQASMQWIKERSQTFDSTLYTKIQQVMEAGRNDFQVNQTRLVDQKRIYETALGYVWRGFWMRLAGYPKIDLEKYKPVVAGDTAKAFETGVQEAIKLR